MSAHSLVKEARKAVITARKQHQDKSPKASLRKINQAQKQLDEGYANAEEENIQGKFDRVPPKNAIHQHVSAWNTIKDLTGRKSKPSLRVNGGSPSERKKNWLDHFKNLLGATLTTSEDQGLPGIQIADALNISTEPLSIEELKAVTSTLKVQTSPGLDNIPALSFSTTYCCASVTTHFSIVTLQKHGETEFFEITAGVLQASPSFPSSSLLSSTAYTPGTAPHRSWLCRWLGTYHSRRRWSTTPISRKGSCANSALLQREQDRVH